MKPILIAHREDTVNFPKNTIKAFQSAFDKSADRIECDVQCNKKGNVIIVHDYLYDKSKQYPLLKKILDKFSKNGRIEIKIKSLQINQIKKITKLIKKLIHQILE